MPVPTEKKKPKFDINKELTIPTKTLMEFFREVAKENKQNNATFFKGKFKTYYEVEGEINRLSNAFQSLGIKKGDRIAVILPNCPQFITSFFATQSLGAIFTALNPMNTPHEIQKQLNDAEPKLLITLDIFTDKIKEIEDELSVEHVIITSVARELPASKKYIYKLITMRKKVPLKNSLNYDTLINQHKNNVIDVPINPKEDVAILQYTGGTTGTSKGAMLTHFNLISQTEVLKYWRTGLDKQPDGQIKIAGVLPYSHIFGLTSSFLWPIAEGATIYLIPDPRKLEEVMEVVDTYKIHFLNCVPVFFLKFATHQNVDKYEYSSLHLCISGGESLPAETVKIFEEKTHCLLIEGYGLTEASPVTHANPPNKEQRRTGSIGVPIPNTQAKIVDTETGEVITDPEVSGEIWIKGPGVMKGYWRNEQATKDSIVDGWLRTGDVAVINTQGYYKIIDRLKDMIIVSGYKVWPTEVEDIILSHPDILEAAIIPHHTEVGTKLKAVLVKHQTSDHITIEELRAYCKQSLAPYKIPSCLEYRDALPRSLVGKVLRRELQAQPA